MRPLARASMLAGAMLTGVLPFARKSISRSGDAYFAALPLRNIPTAVANNPTIATVRGIAFTIDTTEPYPKYRGALTTIGGTAEFAGGRGRVDVASVRRSPVISINGVTLAPPLARAGDYYLFDSTGFTLVRPAQRTFSRFRLSRFTIRHEKGIIPGEEMIRPTVSRVDTLRSPSSQQLNQHGGYTLRTHVERWFPGDTYDPVARVWLEIQDAPAGEASVARFFAAAAAFGTTPKFERIPADSVQVTSLLIVGALVKGRAPLVVTSVHKFNRLHRIDIDPARLTIPAGFTMTAAKR